MPNFDRTGPNSEGSKTGRELGICDKNELLDKIKDIPTEMRRPRRGMRRNQRKLDGTGPNDKGALTGRGLGNCKSEE